MVRHTERVSEGLTRPVVLDCRVTSRICARRSILPHFRRPAAKLVVRAHLHRENEVTSGERETSTVSWVNARRRDNSPFVYTSAVTVYVTREVPRVGKSEG